MKGQAAYADLLFIYANNDPKSVLAQTLATVAITSETGKACFTHYRIGEWIL